LKRFFAGLLAGIIIATAGTAMAAQSDTVQAVFGKFNFKVNGAEVDPGADPLVYQDTTYLPVRVFSNMLGYDVVYRADSRTIELTNQATSQTEMGAKEMSEIRTKPSKITDVNRDEWVIYSETKERFGISYIPAPTGETIIKKGDLKFTLPIDVARQDFNEKVYTDGELSIRIKVVLGSVFYNIEDLKKAGFID